MSLNEYYLDFSPFLRSLYVIDIYISKQQRLSFPRKVGASLSALHVRITQQFHNRPLQYHNLPVAIELASEMCDKIVLMRRHCVISK